MASLLQEYPQLINVHEFRDNAGYENTSRKSPAVPPTLLGEVVRTGGGGVVGLGDILGLEIFFSSLSCA